MLKDIAAVKQRLSGLQVQEQQFIEFLLVNYPLNEDRQVLCAQPLSFVDAVTQVYTEQQGKPIPFGAQAMVALLERTLEKTPANQKVAAATEHIDAATKNNEAATENIEDLLAIRASSSLSSRLSSASP